MNKEILAAIGSKYNADILRVSNQPQSAQELSERLGVPIATCYRRIDQLTDASLLEFHDDALSDQRRHRKVYQRNVDKITIQFNRENMEMDLSYRSEHSSQLSRVRQHNSRRNSRII
ncbi:helix-turn-helix domain-containing protein [Haloquadratum walsbyi]|jgi:hypothetical protein|uniref:Transcriptional regulator n=1 Tax=Haloquadratum walsbyi J07HQW2 TaxID=1238425 RepID=U1NCU5_9EURY|nr:helix-turn-helix domain-containing protein [Haloquadratum walsbyi]ERG94508.1 MAG: transcriptional regulator [Haloquadratum walsbyi J07HQW2]